MKIPISKPYISVEEEEACREVLRSGWIMQGPKVAAFEKAIAEYVGTPYAIAVSSGTAALHLSLLVLGIGNGDEVLVPSFSFIASANCILYVGAKPIFVDIDSKTYNIDPRDLEKKITGKTKAVITVHQIGLPAEMDAIKKICKTHKLFLIEDAACALGAEYKGKKIGSFGDLACFSFHPRKSITTGEGGMITTNNKTLYKKLQLLRSHGAMKKNGEEVFITLGFNYRLTDLQAAIGLMQFKKLPGILQKRLLLAKQYDEAFKKNRWITTPFVPAHVKHTYQSYLIQTHHPKISRDKLAAVLLQNGIVVKKGIMCIHKEPLYRSFKTTLSVTEDVAKHSLLLPLYVQLTTLEQNYITSSVLSMLS